MLRITREMGYRILEQLGYSTVSQIRLDEDSYCPSIEEISHMLRDQLLASNNEVTGETQYGDLIDELAHILKVHNGASRLTSRQIGLLKRALLIPQEIQDLRAVLREVPPPTCRECGRAIHHAEIVSVLVEDGEQYHTCYRCNPPSLVACAFCQELVPFKGIGERHTCERHSVPTIKTRNLFSTPHVSQAAATAGLIQDLPPDLLRNQVASAWTNFTNSVITIPAPLMSASPTLTFEIGDLPEDDDLELEDDDLESDNEN